MRGTIRALTLANEFLEHELETKVSQGYTPGVCVMAALTLIEVSRRQKAGGRPQGSPLRGVRPALDGDQSRFGGKPLTKSDVTFIKLERLPPVALYPAIVSGGNLASENIYRPESLRLSAGTADPVHRAVRRRSSRDRPIDRE
jgi:hypothetical protein